MCSYQEEGDEPDHDAVCLLTPIVGTMMGGGNTATVLYSVLPISLLMTNDNSSRKCAKIHSDTLYILYFKSR